jgi:ABC-type transport system involved in multi-copper enzyme maturation permease subunit
VNQFLAILKDSIREARNGWILQLMLVLCALALLAVGSISFRQTTVKNELDSGFSLMNRFIKGNPNFKTLNIGIDNYSESDSDEPWKANYQFDLVVTTETEEEMTKVKGEQALPGTRYRAERMMRQSLEFLKKVEVKQLPRESKTELAYRVVTDGTKTPDRLSWRHVPVFLWFYDMPIFTVSLRQGVYLFENYVIGGFGAWIVLLVSVVITAGFIPNMMQKGAVDLLISKPIGRPTLLVYKYLGGLTFIFVITSFLIGGTWLMYGVRYGFWQPNLLAAIPILTFYFGIMYSVSVLVGTLTRSTIVAILATVVAWLLFFAIGKVNNGIENRLYDIDNPRKVEDIISVQPGETPDADQLMSSINPDAALWGFIPKASWPVIRGIHAISPRTYQLDQRLEEVIAKGVLSEPEIERKYRRPLTAGWIEVLGVNAAFIGVMLGIACWRFQRRDG